MADSPKIQAQAEISLKGAQEAVDLGERLVDKINEAKESQKDIYDKPLVNIQEEDLQKLQRVQQELERIKRTMEDVRRRGGLAIGREGDLLASSGGTLSDKARYKQLRESERALTCQIGDLEGMGLTPSQFKDQQQSKGMMEKMLASGMQQAGMGGMAGLAGMMGPVAAVAGAGMAARYAYGRMTQDIEYGAEYSMAAARTAQRTGSGGWRGEWVGGVNIPERHLKGGVSYLDYVRLRGQMAGQRIEGSTDAAIDYARLTGMDDPMGGVNFALGMDRVYSGDVGSMMSGIYRTAKGMPGESSRMYGEWQRGMMGFAGGYQQRVGIRASDKYMGEMSHIYSGFASQFGKEGMYQANQIVGQMESAGQGGGAQEGFMLRAFMNQGGGSLLDFERWKEEGGRGYLDAIIGQARKEVGGKYAGYYLKKGGFIKSVGQYDKFLSGGIPWGEVVSGAGGDLAGEAGAMTPEIAALENQRKAMGELRKIGEAATGAASGLAELRLGLAEVNAYMANFGIAAVVEGMEKSGENDLSAFEEMSYDEQISFLNKPKRDRSNIAIPGRSMRRKLASVGESDMDTFYGMMTDYMSESNKNYRFMEKAKAVDPVTGTEVWSAQFRNAMNKYVEAKTENPGAKLEVIFKGNAGEILEATLSESGSSGVPVERKTVGVE